jgi:hypothetical protein
MPTQAEIEAAARALVPYALGAFELQRDDDGNRVQPALQPKPHALHAARAALEAAERVRATTACRGGRAPLAPGDC